MVSIVKSMSLEGLDGYLIEVQTDVAAGLPNFEIVGLPDASVREAKERIKSAIKNTNVQFLSRRILINLAPASKKKEGTILDLPMALGVLVAIGAVKNSDIFQDTIFLGELSLNGKINRINGVLPMCIEAKKLGIKKVVVPSSNANEAAIVEDLEIIPVKTLEDVMDFINYDIKLEENIEREDIFNNDNINSIDFSEVKGQENVKRALEIAASRWTQLLVNRKPWYR